MQQSPFGIVLGRQPIAPHDIVGDIRGQVLKPFYMLRTGKKGLMRRLYLDKASKKMKKFMDKKQRHIDYRIGDKVMVKLSPKQKVF